MKEIKDNLKEILRGIQLIKRYSKGGYEAFMADEMIQDAISKRLETIGQAIKQIPPELLGQHPEVQWKSAAGMRDKLAHDYMGADFNIVWDTVEQKLPGMEVAIQALLFETETPD